MFSIIFVTFFAKSRNDTRVRNNHSDKLFAKARALSIVYIYIYARRTHIHTNKAARSLSCSKKLRGVPRHPYVLATASDRRLLPLQGCLKLAPASSRHRLTTVNNKTRQRRAAPDSPSQAPYRAYRLRNKVPADRERSSKFCVKGTNEDIKEIEQYLKNKLKKNNRSSK